MTKGGRFSYRQIFSYLSGFLKQISQLDLGIRRRAKFFEAKGSDLYYCGGGENVNILYLKYKLIFIARVRRSTVDKSDRVASKCMALILVVEDTEQRRRIVSIQYPRGWPF